MKRSWLSWFAILAMMMMVFAVAGCSDDDDDDNGGGGTPYDVTADVAAAGDAYFDDYMIEFNSVPMGVNVAADGPTGAFAKIVADPDYYYVVDMRSAADFAYAHIEGAVNIETVSELVAGIDNLPTDRIILVACYTGQEASYATALINLLGTQTNHVAQNLKFGHSGILPLELVKETRLFEYTTSNALFPSMVTTASPAKNAEGDYPVLADEVSNPEEALKARAAAAAAAWGVSAGMSAAEAAGETPAELYLINFFSEGAYEDGHLPESIQYGPPNAFTTGQFLNTLPTDMPVAVYCYTGQTSAQVAAYLQMMGYNGKTVYKGVQMMAFDDQGTVEDNKAGINDVPWHGPTDDYTSIFEGTAPELQP